MDYLKGMMGHRVRVANDNIIFEPVEVSTI